MEIIKTIYLYQNDAKTSNIMLKLKTLCNSTLLGCMSSTSNNTLFENRWDQFLEF